MILSHAIFIRATSPRLVILRASDKDALRISTDSVGSDFALLQGCKSEGKP
jgi:hypothetical protein